MIGVLPGLIAADANPFVDVVVPTGMNYARNTILVAMADVVVAVGGGSGTLSEIALAWQHGKPIVTLDLGEGWSRGAPRPPPRRPAPPRRERRGGRAARGRAGRQPSEQPWVLSRASS